MYRDKPTFRARPTEELIDELRDAAAQVGHGVQKVFVADGDALVMDTEQWIAILDSCTELFPSLRRVSCYATARNLLEKSEAELRRLREAGLDLLYMGPESGDDVTLKRLAKGATAEDHIKAARRAKDAGMRISAIFLLGAGGVERSQEHAVASGQLASAMDPEFLSALTLTIVPSTPLAKLAQSDRFVLPPVTDLLAELRTMVAHTKTTNTLFRTNHASNYLPLGGRLPADQERIVATIDAALSGDIALRPEYRRGL
jgi:radical SAM superfamily enzyme YgiQ (UPF0313 family)